MNNKKIVLKEIINNNSNEDEDIKNPTLDGLNFKKFKENLLNEESEDVTNHILANSIHAINLFKNPHSKKNFNKPLKILCLGKVQSGKTAFFLGSIALAFDNGYDIAYVLGGTKNKLKKQNLERISNAFNNNDKICIFDLNKKFNKDILSLIKNGKKIIIVILKQVAEKTDLGKLKELADSYANIPSLIIDDEGDEYTPGAERQNRLSNNKKNKKRAGGTHDAIVKIISTFDICTFLSVTATPQANLLVSTYDGISPDRLVLVQPGKGYTGGQTFFDIKENPHVSIINDEDDFINSIPTSFKEALNFYIFACALKRTKNDFNPYSMLVHPSSLNTIQNTVADRINDYISNNIQPIALSSNSIQYDDFVNSLQDSISQYVKINGEINFDTSKIMNEVVNVIKNLTVIVVNYKNVDEDDNDEQTTDNLYKIKVGGNMLGRGLTINRLIVSYIYRDSKVSQIDTLYQRCRWFGYKKKYFDVCKVYMTAELQKKFMAIVTNEDYMWNSMEAFLNSEIDLKYFKRIFYLNNDKLILTRRSVANTVTLKISSTINQQDTCIELTPEQIDNNRNIYFSYCKKHETEGEFVDFDNSINHRQRHLLIKTKYTEFYEEFLSKFTFAYGSNFSNKLFGDFADLIKNNKQCDEILIMLMRYKIGEHRSPTDSTMMNITGLFQGRNEGTNFSGDRYPIDINGIDYSKVPFIQVHMVDLNNINPVISESIPLISFNNTYTSDNIKLVTGDNFYEN